MSNKLNETLDRVKKLNFLLENQHEINARFGWDTRPREIDEDEVDEVSKGLATRAFNKIDNKHKQNGNAYDNDALQYTKDLQQADKFGAYMNPAITAELKKLGFDINKVSHQEIVLDFYADKSVQVLGKPDVKIGVYQDAYRVLSGNLMDLGEPRQRTMIRLIKKIQSDWNAGNGEQQPIQKT